jgi:hypothetical protein
MAPHDFASEMMKLQELTNLVGIPGRQQDLMTPFPKLSNDWQKEWNVGRVIYINPDFLFTSWSHVTSKFTYGQLP